MINIEIKLMKTMETENFYKNQKDLNISESSTKSPSFVDSDDSLYEVDKRPNKRPVGRPRKIISDSDYHTTSPSITEDNIPPKRPVGRPKKDVTLERNKDLNTNKLNSISISNYSNAEFSSDKPFTRLRQNFGKSSTMQPNYCELDLELDKNNVHNVDPFEGNDIKRNMANILAEYKMRNEIKNYQTYLELKLKEKECVIVLIA